MPITLRPNGYVICALAAGSLVGGSLAGQPSALFPLLAFWVLADLALGAFYGGLVEASGALPWAQPGRRPRREGLLTAAFGGALAILVAGLFAAPVRHLVAAGLAGGALVVLAGASQPEREAIPLLVGLQVSLAWSLGLMRTVPWQSPLQLLGLAAGIGTWLRLRHREAPARATLWAARIVWLGWAGVLVAARQPLLAGLVAVTALADDLHRLAPRRRPAGDALTTLGWLGTWLLVAVASTYWGNLH